MARKKSDADVNVGTDETEVVIEKSLTKKEVKCYQQMLLAKLQQAERVLGREIPNTMASDPADLAAQETAVHHSLHEQEVARSEIMRLRQALAKIDAGEFGICEDCGEQIPRKHLDCQPMASCCVDCTKEREKQARLQGIRGGMLKFSEI